MKKYDIITVAVVILYVIVALLTGIQIGNMEETVGSEYKVEINRLQRSVFADGLFVQPDLSKCRYVKEVTFIKAKDLDDKVVMNEFYRPGNGTNQHIQPVYTGDKLEGFVRYDYVVELKLFKIMLAVEIAIAALFIIIVVVLLYIRRNILKPFHMYAKLPQEMAKGRLHNEIEESKNKYFGNFLWGLSLLQNKLDYVKRKELKLEKEKKMMILSISHDIKTPLNNIKLYAKALEEQLYAREQEKNMPSIKLEKKPWKLNSF